MSEKNCHNKQCGMVLIILFLTMLMIVSGVLISRLNQSKDSVLQNQIKAQQHNAQILAEAKAALLGFAVSYAETHIGQPVGYLPCPDRNANGSAQTCGEKSKSFIGCFPYRTLGMQKLTDYFGNELWYVVSGNYKDNPKQGLTNDTNGLFQIQDQHNNVITGNNEESRAIAIVFAPNIAINGQTRGNLDCKKPESYLDSLANIDNAKGTKLNATAGEIGSENLPTALPSVFVNAPISSVFNDQMIWITPEDYVAIYEKMNRWVAKRVQYCLKQYAALNGDRLPWTAALNITDYTDVLGLKIGKIPLGNSSSSPALLLSNTIATNSSMSNEWTVDTWLKDITNSTTQDCSTNLPPCKCFDNNLTDSHGYWGNWWTNWKEKVFIIVNDKNTPDIIQTTDSGLKLDNNLAQFVILVQKKKNVSDDHNLILFKQLAGESPVVSPETFSTQDVNSSNSIACSDQSCL